MTAVGDREGTVELFVPAHGVHASLVAREANARVFRCPITTLDRGIRECQIPLPTVIKIDVEGAEFEVLRGAANLLRDHTPVLIFESDDNCEQFGYRRVELLRWLANQADHTFFRVAPGDVLASPRHRREEFGVRYLEERDWQR
jgi:hypothetical protein